MSNINPNNIDGTFPIAGQDNSSQGFRDNFTNIVNNFSYAATEISDLQSKAITTSALTGGTLSNNMSYNPIQYAQLFSPSYTFLDQGTQSAGSTILADYSVASAQKFTTAGTLGITNTLSFQNWPTTGQLGRLIVWVSVAYTPTTGNPVADYTLVVPASVNTTALNDIAGGNPAGPSITFDEAGDYFFEFTSTNNGTTVNIRDLSRNYATLRDPNFYWNDTIAPTLLAGFGATQTSFQTILEMESGEDTIVAKGSYNSVAVGNLSLGTIVYPQIDTGPLSGYSVTSLRGNLQTGTLSAAASGDFLGYFNSISYTGTGVGNPNTFQQLASLGMYATGSNVITGLGGNIAVFTHNPSTTANVVSQVVGFENDQSANFYGNVTVQGNLNVQGTTNTINSEVITTTEVVAGQLTASSGATSTSVSTGALVVVGGAGISGTVNVGGVLSVASAIQFANLTTAQVVAIASPQRGMTVYNYNTGNVQVYNGTKWANITLS